MFNAIVDNIHAGVLVEDGQRRVVAANRFLGAMFGGEGAEEDLVGADAVALNARFARVTADPEIFSTRTTELVRERSLVSGDRIRLANGRTV